MSKKLKALDQQVMVITGASSGIGLATALAAADAGVRLVLSARSDQTLRDLVEEIRRGGGEAHHVTGDVAERDVHERAAQAAMDYFGIIDTWVNNAGVSIYGRVRDVSDEDSRRLFETNFWGVVFGSLTALAHLERSQGALINVGSEVSEAIVPLQGMYSASKHAVKGFTDALRVELAYDEAPVSVTLIQPGATNTPFPQHARNYMDREPALLRPLDDPFHVAEAILAAASSEKRAIKVSAMAKMNVALAKFAPALGERMSQKQMERQHYDEPPRDPRGTLFEPKRTGSAYGSGGRRVKT